MKKFVAIFSLIFIFAGQLVLAADNCATGGPNNDCYGLETSAPEDLLDSPSGGVAEIAGTLIGQVLAFVGVIFFGLVLYGGFKWMTAQGNVKQTEEARDIIVRAAIGLIIIFSAYAITSFIGDVAQNPEGTTTSATPSGT